MSPQVPPASNVALSNLQSVVGNRIAVRALNTPVKDSGEVAQRVLDPKLAERDKQYEKMKADLERYNTEFDAWDDEKEPDNSPEVPASLKVISNLEASTEIATSDDARKAKSAAFETAKTGKLGSAKSVDQSQIVDVKVEVFTVGDVQNVDDKLAAIKAAIDKVTASDVVLPEKVEFYIAADKQTMTETYSISADLAHVIIGPKTGQPLNTKTDLEGIPHQIGFESRGRGDAGAAKRQMKAQFEATVVHELGHVAHARNEESAYWQLEAHGLNKTLTKEPSLSTAQEGNAVSDYAKKSDVEFVAEVFTGLMYGRKYPGNIMARYRSLGGTVPAGNAS